MILEPIIHATIAAVFLCTIAVLFPYWQTFACVMLAMIWLGYNTVRNISAHQITSLQQSTPVMIKIASSRPRHQHQSHYNGNGKGQYTQNELFPIDHNI